MTNLWEVLEAYPELVVILSVPNVWPADRRLRPFLREFPHTYIELSLFITDGGIEDLVKECGSGRVLYGSGFQRCHFGGNMLNIKHAQVPEKDKLAIASGNIQNILQQITY